MIAPRVYSLDDPDLPAIAQVVKRVFLTPKFGEPPPGKGYQKFLAEKERLQKKHINKQRLERQTTLQIEKQLMEHKL